MSSPDVRPVAPAHLTQSLRFELKRMKDQGGISELMMLRDLIGRAYAAGHQAGYMAGIDDCYATHDPAQPESAPDADTTDAG